MPLITLQISRSKLTPLRTLLSIMSLSRSGSPIQNAKVVSALDVGGKVAGMQTGGSLISSQSLSAGSAISVEHMMTVLHLISLPLPLVLKRTMLPITKIPATELPLMKRSVSVWSKNGRLFCPKHSNHWQR